MTTRRLLMESVSLLFVLGLCYLDDVIDRSADGLYVDGGVDIVIEGNLIHDTVRSPLRFHKAERNLVRGNIVTLGDGVPLVRYNRTPEKHIILEANTVIPAGHRGAVFQAALERMQRDAGPTPEWRQRLGAR